VILTGSEIANAVNGGEIVIEPFVESHLGPNSYDFRLGSSCLIYGSNELDSALRNPTVAVEFPSEGLVLDPKRIYLFDTLERMGSRRYVPIIRGRSSVGRLGVFINVTADLIDIGSINKWTLQLHSVQPVRVYPGMRIGQVTFWRPEGDIIEYAGRYRNLASPVPSLSYLDFTPQHADESP
jgi:dCTP deaminase